MGLNNEWKLIHVQSLLNDKEVAAYATAYKDMTEADLKVEMKTLKTAQINEKIAELEKELAEISK
jgi:hypothetical protein